MGRTTVRRRPEHKKIKICPQCQSDRLIFEAGLITGQVYHCLQCNYIGSLILEIDAPEPLEK
jgi:transposase-like protein